MTEGWHYGDLWDLAADVRGDQPAMILGDLRRSWYDLRDRAARLASSLVAGGAGQGDRIALYLYNGPEYLEGTYAAFQAGLTPVNTNYRYRSDELAYLWDNADAVAVVFHGTFSHTVDAVRDRVPTVTRWLWVDDGSGPCPPWAEPYERVLEEGPPGPFFPSWGRSGDDVVMIYTGGTTGLPKGVMWSHHDMYRAFSTGGDADELDLAAVRRRLEAAAHGPVGLPGSPLMHATGFMFAVSILTQGGTVVTLPQRSFDADALLDAVARERVEALAIVGDAFARPMLEALDTAAARDLSALAMVVSAGVMWSAETKAGLAKHLPGALLVDLLGSTEAHGLGSSVAGPGEEASTARFRLGHHAMVIDEHDRRLGPGGTGKLAVGGPCPIGYHKDPDKTARTFRMVEGQRVSVPGDWATVEADGTITLLGRGSLCINTGGEKVFPEEVEEALETHPAVRDSTVVGVPDLKLGEAVAAVVELVAGASATEADLVAHVKAQLAGYKAPRHLLIVEDVGRSPNGKADYSRARTLLLDRLPSVTT
ncbi:MAG: AMP-binding protein [Actinomycetota bacterium]